MKPKLSEAQRGPAKLFRSGRPKGLNKSNLTNLTMDITKITSRGQVVIPQEIRKKEGLREGEKLLVYDLNGTIILKRLEGLEAAKSVEDFEAILKSMWAKTKARGVTARDVEREIAAYRKEKNASRSARHQHARFGNYCSWQ